MNAKTFASLLLAFAFCTLNFNTASAGRGKEDSQGQQCEDEEGDIDGNETLEAKIILVATADAPEGAKGCAKLEAENEDGFQVTELEIKTSGLVPGDYVVSVVRKSDGSSVTLGQITIDDCVKNDDEDEDEDDDEDEIRHNGAVNEDDHDGDKKGKDDGDDEDEDEDEDEDGDHNGHGNGDCELRSESEMELPADLDPMDIAQIIISDTSDIALLIGDFVEPADGTKIKFKACIELTPDEGAPECQGTARVSCTAKNGKQKNRFTMVASDVPANSTFDVQVDGETAGTVKSNKKGKVLVKKLPGNLTTVRSVELTDSEGKAVAKAKF